MFGGGIRSFILPDSDKLANVFVRAIVNSPAINSTVRSNITRVVGWV